MRHLTLIVPILLVLALPVLGASSYLGPTGAIATPNDLVIPLNTWELGYHNFLDVFGGVDFQVISVNYGLAPNLEVGASFTSNGEDDTALNAKYLLIAETATQPGVAVGVFDATGVVNVFGDDPGFYVVASKSITGFAAAVAGEPVNPLRLSIGLGSGVFDGLFAHLNWVASPQTQIMLEYINNDFENLGDSGGSSVNAGIRYAITDNIRLDAAVIDFQDFALGASLRTTF